MTLPRLLRICLPVAVGIAAAHTAVAMSVEPLCSQTPELALSRPQSPVNAVPSLIEAGYRVTAVRWDPLLNQRWAMVASCSHPERPSVAMRLPDSRSVLTAVSRSSQTPFPVVHAGDLVQMWSQESNLRIEAAGRAVEAGTVGSRVRVRLLHSGFDLGQEQTLVGIVRGPGDVEMQR